MKRERLGLLLAASLLLAACAPGSPGTLAPSGSPGAAGAAADIELVAVDLPRADPGTAPPDALSAVVAADSGFAFDLYRELIGTERGNLFVSPFSVSTALSMTWAGARGETASQLADVLGIAIAPGDWHAGRNALDLALADVSEAPQLAGDVEPLTLEVANGLFGQADYPFERPFLTTIAEDYGAGLLTVDFMGASEPARVGINRWVAERTRERIDELLPEGSIDEMTRLVLVNAIYFNGNWIVQFAPEQTRSEPFRRLDGSSVTVATMHGVGPFDYAEADGWQAVRLPYWGGASMLIVAPQDGRFAEIEGQLGPAFLAGVRASLAAHQVTLAMPKWDFASTIGMNETLQALGVRDAFVLPPGDGSADFTAITAERVLYVSDVFHQANVTVDEHGTEAAAATAVVVREVSLPPAATLSLDRPFIFLLQDDETGEILFLGRVLDPATS